MSLPIESSWARGLNLMMGRIKRLPDGVTAIEICKDLCLFYISCVRAAKALVDLSIYTGLSKTVVARQCDSTDTACDD